MAGEVDRPSCFLADALYEHQADTCTRSKRICSGGMAVPAGVHPASCNCTCHADTWSKCRHANATYDMRSRIPSGSAKHCLQIQHIPT
jgi:hypothetical protein